MTLSQVVFYEFWNNGILSFRPILSIFQSRAAELFTFLVNVTSVRSTNTTQRHKLCTLAILLFLFVSFALEISTCFVAILHKLENEEKNECQYWSPIPMSLLGYPLLSRPISKGAYFLLSLYLSSLLETFLL